MPCSECNREGRHHPWCLNCPMGDGGSFADYMSEQVDTPWALEPPEWLMTECMAPTLDLPVLTIDPNDLNNARSPNLLLLADAAAAVEVDLSMTPMFEPMDLVNGEDLECKEESDELSTMAVDREMFERSRSPNELIGHVGPNSPVEMNTPNNTLENLMRSAQELTSALAAYNGPIGEQYSGKTVISIRPQVMNNDNRSESRCTDCSKDGPCPRAICSIAPEIVITEPPQSPDYESDRECWSDSSDIYQPVVSPVSPASDRRSKVKNNDYEMGPSKAQKYWSGKVQRKRSSTQVKRVATIRPRAFWRRPAVIQGLLDPRRFRVTTQSPILQTRAIVERTIAVDGSVMERAVHDQFVMSRSMATQTGENNNGFEDCNCGQEVSTQTQVSSHREMATQTMDPHEDASDQCGQSVSTQTEMSYVLSLQNDTSEEEWQIISDCDENSEEDMEEGSESSEHECDESELSEDDSEDDSEESDGDETEGTPVQDENETDDE
jgi:hypothetical protein